MQKYLSISIILGGPQIYPHVTGQINFYTYFRLNNQGRIYKTETMDSFKKERKLVQLVVGKQEDTLPFFHQKIKIGVKLVSNLEK